MKEIKGGNFILPLEQIVALCLEQSIKKTGGCNIGLAKEILLKLPEGNLKNIIQAEIERGYNL